MSTVSVHVVVSPVLRHGIEQWAALVVEVGTDRALYSTVRWSESQARADASRWIQRHGAE